MRSRRLTPLGRIVLGCIAVAIIALLAGCTSVVQGSGHQLAGTRSGGPKPTSTSPPDFPSTSSGPTGSTISSKYPRTPIETAIGDPAVSDVCAAIGTSWASGLKYTATLADYMYPPGCSIRMMSGSTVAFSVSVYGAAPSSLTPQTGRTTRTESGLQVYVYRYDSVVGNCQRNIAAGGILLEVNTFKRTGGTPTDYCAAADAATRTLAAATARGPFPKASLADPSISSLDFCGVLKAVNVSTMPEFVTGKIAPDGVSAGCQLSTKDFYFYVDFTLMGTSVPADSRAKTVGGHLMYAGTSDTATDCSLTSVQGTTSNGKHEAVSVSAGDYGSGIGRGTTLCDDTARVLSGFLDAAGLH